MKLIKILSDKIQIKTDCFEFSDAKINDLIKISDGKVDLLTSVTSLSDTDISTPDDEYIEILESIKTIECSIIGSIKNGKFIKAIDQYPEMNIQAIKISKEEFSSIIKCTDSVFSIGFYTEYECPAYIDGNKFFQRHSCIVGNTGSGKSETVAKILEESSKLPGTNIIVFDIHGEYRNLSYSDNIKIGEDFPFPIWMFGFSEMVSNIFNIKEESSNVYMAAMRKAYKSICRNANEGKPIYFDIYDFLYLLVSYNEQTVGTGEFYKSGDKAGLEKTTKGDFNGKLSTLIHILKSKIGDKRYSFLFSDVGQWFLNKFVSRIMGSEKPVKNIDLSDIPHDIAIPIIGSVTKLVYELKKEIGDKINPITIVCDEAHVYIPNNFQLSASERRMVEVFENIAKEGRKFGVTLFVASQRPSELNKTIMAQCANFIVSKLNNENDKSMIKGMLPDGNESVIDSTTMFSPGDVLVIGDASPIPIKIHVSLAKERPESRTIDFWSSWKEKKTTDFSEDIDDFLK